MTDQTNFTKQTIRKDILNNMLNNILLNSNDLYKILITDNNTTYDESRIGFLFETLSIILLICKCLKIKYTNIMDGQLQSLKICTNINDILKHKISQGNNPSDITIKHDNKIIAFSIKYRNKFKPNQSSVTEIDGELNNTKNEYSIGLIVRDKSLVESHKYKNDAGNQKKLHSKLIEDNLLFDKNDIIMGLEKFCKKFKNNNYILTDFIEIINSDCLLSSREQLILKLHQKMTYLKFIRTKNINMHLISHKPRSGKSITLLNISKYLLKNGSNKILVMTSVPATINSFIQDLEKYIDFKNIKYIGQEDFKNINNNFKGIVFCSVQYLKTNVDEKKAYLKNIKFDTIIIDECHMGSSTKKTEKDILNIDMGEHIDDIRNNIKINIFASGTSDKTKKFYKIKSVYEWDIEDEGFMKEIYNNILSTDEKNELLEIMVKRHGNEFMECYNDNTLNKDYSTHPTQVLMKHSLPDNIINEIQQYNIKNDTNYGYSCSSLFALDKIINKKNNKYEYDNVFELEKSSDGIELLKSFFDCIISNKKMKKNTIIKNIEETQSTYKSRISQKGDPKLFLMYLPTHTRNNNISQLQINFKRFIEKYNLWSDYNIEYSNSIDDSGDYKEEYNTYIKTILDKSLKENKKGCILLLGNKGGVGITYHDCDVTISLDEGHNLDNQKQRYSRALTEGINKTIGINVDMNIQRTYLYLNEILHKHRNITKTTKTNGEILKYLYVHNIFLFNPTEINNGKIKSFEITSYYNKEAENILKNIDDTNLLNDIIVEDGDIILDNNEIGLEFSWNNTTNQLETKIINSNLEGEQHDCPKGGITKIIIDDKEINNNSIIEEPLTKIEEDKIEKQKRILKEVCRRVLFPLLSLLSRTYQQMEFKNMLYHSDTKEIVNSILKDKKIILNINSYNSIIKIMNNNNDIINNIREIYRTAPANKIYQLIAKHFIPSLEEKKENAEIPTPILLVEEMLNKIPDDFWTTPKMVFEPCCGKGNFVMKIFEKFFNGLQKIYPNKIERCKIIMTKCLYYADLTPLNVFITTEILKCDIQSKTEIDEINYTFNSYTGDTLELDINKTFNIDKFDAVIGNPPYHDGSGNKGKGHTLWTRFIEVALNKLLKENGYLVYVHPSVWRQLEHPCLNLIKDKQLIYLEIHNVIDGQKMFKCATRYDWYLLQNKKYDINTIIKSEDGKINNINLKEWSFIPNMMFDDIEVLINNSKNKLDVNNYRTNYGADKKWVSKIKTVEFKYPVVYSINKNNELSLRYSNTNKNGHFGLSKFIFSNGAGLYCDNNGDYGLTQWSYCIYDINENLPLIEKTFRSSKFNKIKDAIQLDSSTYNIKVMKLFNKNFYNDFINNINETSNNISDEPEETIINTIEDEIQKKKAVKKVIENNNVVIKYKRKNYYLIENKIYIINKNKSIGNIFGNYIDDKVIEIK